MKILSSVFCIAMLGFSGAIAAPPPGHPSTDDAAKILNIPQQQDFKYQGEVQQAIDSNAYTYIQVRILDQNIWLAAPRIALSQGQQIRFPAGTVMHNFYSRKLKRTFTEVLFVAAVDVVPDNI